MSSVSFASACWALFAPTHQPMCHLCTLHKHQPSASIDLLAFDLPIPDTPVPTDGPRSNFDFSIRLSTTVVSPFKYASRLSTHCLAKKLGFKIINYLWCTFFKIILQIKWSKLPIFWRNSELQKFWFRISQNWHFLNWCIRLIRKR